MEISGKKALVFGGTSGIGLATAKSLAEKGAEVIAVSRDPSKAGDLPNNVHPRSVDVLNEKDMIQFFSETAPFDILISAATGGSRSLGPFLEMEIDGYKNSFAKLWGYAHVVRHGTPHLSKNGCVVLVSGAPARKCKPGQVALSSVGGAVEALARAVAPEIKPKRINVVSPGSIDTPMLPLQGEERESAYKKMTEDNLIARAGTAEEVAKGIIFVVENDFVTGTTVDVDGGWLLS